MLKHLNASAPQIAGVRFTEADFQVLTPGSHVACAITGEMIPLDELKYWSYERQEAYMDATSSLEAELRAGNLR